MAIVKMRKIRIAALLSDRDPIIKTLQRLGVIDIDAAKSELCENDGEPEKQSLLEQQASYIREAISFLKRNSGIKKPLFAVKAKLTRAEFENINERLNDIAGEARSVLDKRDDITRMSDAIGRANNLIAALEPWAGMDVDLSETETTYSELIFGVLPAATATDETAARLDEAALGTILSVLGRNTGGTDVYAIYLKEFAHEVNTVLKDADFNRINFKELKGTPSHNIAEQKSRIADLESSIAAARAELAAKVSLIPDLEAAGDFAASEAERFAILGRLLRTDSVFALTGWLPADSSEKVTSELMSSFECFAETEEAGDDEPEYPIKLKNNKIFAPFESITEMFSLPVRNNIDPSPFMAPFFIMFFGIMLSDAAYGIILSVAMAVIIKKYNPKGTMGNIMRIFFMCGISTLFWGAMFGGWFGNLASMASGGKINIKPLWFDPMNDPIKLMAWALGFGFLQVMTSMVLKAYIALKNKDWQTAVFDTFSWMAVFLGGGLAILGKGPLKTAGFAVIALGVATIVIFRARDDKNPVKRIFRGIGGLYDIVAYMSDILSYSRLLALGLATGVIANVFNTMALLGGKSVFGILMFVVVVTIGTLFNIAVNVLGAYVHSSRLQYIEFFTRFYEGGGRPFRPFKTNTIYTELLDEEANNK